MDKIQNYSDTSIGWKLHNSKTKITVETEFKENYIFIGHVACVLKLWN